MAPQTRPFEESQQHGSLSFNFTEIVKNFALAKVFQSPISPSDKSWCQKGKFKPKTPTAILYNKMPKAASSTMSGITLRIAYRLGERLYGGKNICANRVDHVAQVNSTGKLFSNRVKIYDNLLRYMSLQIFQYRAIQIYTFHKYLYLRYVFLSH